MSTAKPHQTSVSCTRCGNHYLMTNNGLVTCPDCHQRDIDFTINFGNQVRILQIDVSLMNISSNYRRDVLAKLEKEKLELQ
jgi:Zn finger protein HypA/HybF involved in hydrogenase expression